VDGAADVSTGYSMRHPGEPRRIRNNKGEDRTGMKRRYPDPAKLTHRDKTASRGLSGALPDNAAMG
jgi:hypothetical protein